MEILKPVVGNANIAILKFSILEVQEDAPYLAREFGTFHKS